MEHHIEGNIIKALFYKLFNVELQWLRNGKCNILNRITIALFVALFVTFGIESLQKIKFNFSSISNFFFTSVVGSLS